MLKSNKNRGAGLVTVVVVLAVSGILLSGAIWLSYTHYKNVMLVESENDVQTEIELCAELLCMHLNNNSTVAFSSLGVESSFLLQFYGPENVTYSYETKKITIQLSYSDKLILSSDYDSLGEGIDIEYYRNGDSKSVKSFVCVFSKEAGSTTYVYSLSELQSTDSEGEQPNE